MAHLPGYNMVLTAFPNDLSMPGLRQVILPDQLEPLVGAALGLPGARLEGTEDGSSPVKIISYKPERSCLIHCAVGELDPQAWPESVYMRQLPATQLFETIIRSMDCNCRTGRDPCRRPGPAHDHRLRRRCRPRRWAWHCYQLIAMDCRGPTSRGRPVLRAASSTML